MRQAIMTSPGTIELKKVSKPLPDAGEVMLRIHRIGVCGSDVHVWHGKHPFTPYPVVQGHEYAGVVEAVGEGVEGIEPGMKATATPQVVCGRCGPCRRGDYHICDSLKVEGFQAPGVAQDWFVTRADRIVLLPDGFSFEQGALVEPTAVAVHALARAGDVCGRTVAVLGAGPIGNLVAQVAQSRGARVLVTDVSDYRLGVAKQCGLEAVSNAAEERLGEAARREFGETGIEIVFDCAGVAASIEAAVEEVNKGGLIVVVAVFEEKPAVALSLVQDRELTLTGTLMYQHADYEEAVRLIERGEVVTGPLDSRHFPLEEYAAAYRFIDEQGGACMKVFIDVD